MVSRAAADDVEAAYILDGSLVQCQLRQIDLAVLQARRDRVAYSGGLLVDFLHHEMLVATLFGCFGIPFDGSGLAGDGFLVDIEEVDGIRCQAGDFQIVNVVDRTGVLEQRGNIGGDDGTVPALADDEGAVLAHGVDDAGFIGKQHAQRVGAAHMDHHAGDGIQRVAGGLAGVIVVQQLSHNLGVGLGDEGEAFVQQALFNFLVVFNDAVVYDSDFLVTGIVRVGVDDGRFAMSSPAGMADAAAAGDRAAAVGHFAQNLQAALGLDDLDFTGSVLHGQTGRVIAAVFQFRQAIQQNGRGLRRTGEAYDSTHSRYPPLL